MQYAGDKGDSLYCIAHPTASILALIAVMLLSAAHAQTLTVTMTAYSSEVIQTDSTPFITSTGAQVGLGIVAVSRDLLGGALPYGTKLRIVGIKANPRACGAWDPGIVLEVQDTMHRRKRNQVDIWLPSRAEAIRWGRCEVILEIIELPYDVANR